MRKFFASVTDMAGTAPGGVAPQVPARGGPRLRLGAARRGAKGTIVEVQAPPTRPADAIEAAELERRLLEMGFIEGARFEVLHEGPLGGDPIAVKLDDTRVALRRRDADALLVELDREYEAA